MPGNNSFLVIPFALHWGECTASRLIHVDIYGAVHTYQPAARRRVVRISDQKSGEGRKREEKRTEERASA
jgi:hypothetical protein